VVSNIYLDFMTLDKIIIIDDKSISQSHSSIELVSKIDEIKSQFIEYYESTIELWSQNASEDDIILLKDFSVNPFIFIHDSFDNPLVQDGLQSDLIGKLSKTSNVVLFSGCKQESSMPLEKIIDESDSKKIRFYEIKREQYFNNLKNFIDSFLISGQYQIKYLYNPYLNPKKDKAYSLLEIIKTDLEESIQSAIESNSFNELLSLYEYKNTSEISSRFLKMTDDEFVENLEDFIENN
jgi:hypothetical protein